VDAPLVCGFTERRADVLILFFFFFGEVADALIYEACEVIMYTCWLFAAMHASFCLSQLVV
jgi:hypothetical protein